LDRIIIVLEQFLGCLRKGRGVGRCENVGDGAEQYIIGITAAISSAIVETYPVTSMMASLMYWTSSPCRLNSITMLTLFA
jgi:hypothetical protein